MQFTLISILALVSVALAISPEEHNEVAKRQANVASIPLNVAAMTDKDGNVIEFDANGVYLDSVAKGL